MHIDPSKVNLSEADIEEYLWRNPGAVSFAHYWMHKITIKRWLKRQFSIPSGILDLFGETERGELVVVEVKNVEVDARAIAQVCRYAFDMKLIMDIAGYFGHGEYDPESIHKVIVGPSIGTTALRECEACGVHYVQFAVRLTLDTGEQGWTEKFRQARVETYRELAGDEELQSVARAAQARRAYDEAYQERVPSEQTEARDEERQRADEEKQVSDLVDEYLDKTIAERDDWPGQGTEDNG